MTLQSSLTGMVLMALVLIVANEKQSVPYLNVGYEFYRYCKD